MSAAAVPSAAPAPVDRGSVLEAYRDDGPLATALGRALGRRIPLPPIALLLVAGLPLLARDRRSRATAPRTGSSPA